MVVLLLERVPASLRGELTRWLLELRPGVFIGQVSATVRDGLWEEACAALDKPQPASSKAKAGGMLIYNTDNEQGFAIRSWGDPTRKVIDFDGISLVRVP